MVNRVLIRMKVVQLLYSYLLTRSEFKINPAPSVVSRDKKYAYQIYMSLMLLIIELSGYSVKNGMKPPVLYINKKIEANRVAKALLATDEVKAAIRNGDSGVEVFDGILQYILDKITASKVFIDYCKKTHPTLNDDVILWTTLLDTLFATDPQIISVLRERGDFTNQGFLSGIRDLGMTLRAYDDARSLFNKAKDDLAKSLDEAYRLYLWLFTLVLDITEEQERRIEAAKSKLLATSQDLNPNIKLISNKLVDYLNANVSFNDLIKENKISRSDMVSPLVRTLLDQILESDIYKSYIESDEDSLRHDTEFWRDVFRTIIFPSDALAEDLEDKSVYWNDDLQIMGTFMLKTLRQIAQCEGEEIEMLPKFKDSDDEAFGPDLFVFTVRKQEAYRSYIDMFIKKSNWDPERLAFMDIVILTTAIAEIVNYPSIPVPVTVNEYVEIANGYSTEKSGAFINGILVSVVKYLNENGIINK